MHTSFSVLVDVSTNRIIVNPKGAIYRQSRRSFPAGNQSMHHTFKAVTHDLPTIHHCVIIYGGIFSLAESESGNRSLVLDAEPKKVQLSFFTFSLIKRMARIFFFFCFLNPEKVNLGVLKTRFRTFCCSLANFDIYLFYDLLQNVRKSVKTTRFANITKKFRL